MVAHSSSGSNLRFTVFSVSFSSPHVKCSAFSSVPPPPPPHSSSSGSQPPAADRSSPSPATWGLSLRPLAGLTGCRLLLSLAVCLLPFAFCLLPFGFVSFLLPLASCRWPFAFAVLLFACCLLPWGEGTTKSNLFSPEFQVSPHIQRPRNSRQAAPGHRTRSPLPRRRP